MTSHLAILVPELEKLGFRLEDDTAVRSLDSRDEQQIVTFVRTHEKKQYDERVRDSPEELNERIILAARGERWRSGNADSTAARF